MATAFEETRFPTDISFGSVGGPEFSTGVIELGNKAEQRNQNWVYPRERWDVAYGIKAKADLVTLLEFFYAMRGRLTGFRFKSPDDFEATTVSLGMGDGSTTDFQLVKTYTVGSLTFIRKISKPVAGTVIVYLDAVDQGSAWSIDITTGLVSLDVAPASGEEVTATFQFDIPVRFDVDYMPEAFSNYEAREASVPLLEVKV